LATKLSNTQLRRHRRAAAFLGLLSPFGHTKSLFPATEQVISSAILLFAETPSAVRSSASLWAARKHLHGYYASSASLSTSGNSSWDFLIFA